MRFIFCFTFVLCLWACSDDQTRTNADDTVSESISAGNQESGNDVIVKNVSLIDGTGADLQAGVDIRISRGRIAEIGPRLSASSGTDVIDGTGKYVIPGLIDAHVHLDAPVVFQLTPEEKTEVVTHTPKAFLYNGVTTVLNLSSDIDWIFEQRSAEREGRLVSPRIYAMGRSFTPEGGWGGRHGGALADAKAARLRALEYVDRDADGFKVVIEDGLGATGSYVRMDEEMMMAIRGVAQEHNIPIYSHAINLDEFHLAVEMSSRAIVHGLEDPIPVGDSILQDMHDRNIAFVPTQSLWESFLRHDDAAADLDNSTLRNSVPHFLLDYMQDSAYRSEETRRFLAVARMPVYEWAEEKIPVFRENILKAHQAGVLIAVGTDAGGPVGYNFQGYNTPWEVKLLVQAGMSPMDALVAATRNGAIVIGEEDQLGTIEVGKLADFLVLTENPLDDIENIRDIETIVYKGTAYPRQEFAYQAPDP